MAYGCEISDQTVTTLLSGDLAVGAAAFNRCIWKGITTARCVLCCFTSAWDDRSIGHREIPKRIATRDVPGCCVLRCKHVSCS